MCRVDIVTGRLSLSELDFEVFGLLPVVLKRHYRSTNLRQGDLGYGWGHSLGAQLWQEDDNTLVFRAADGRRIGLADPRRERPSHLPQERMAISYLPAQALEWERLQPELIGGAFALSTMGQFTLLFDARALEEQYAWRGIVDLAGNLVHVVPDPQGRPSRLEDPWSRIFHLQHDAQRRLSSVHLSEAREPDVKHLLVRYEYDQHHDLVAAHDPAGTRRYQYENHVLVEHWDRTGRSCRSQFDKRGRCILVSGPGGVHQRTYDYAPAENRTTVRDSLGNQSVYAYDESGATVESIDENGGKSLFEYDERGRPLKVTNQMGHETVFAYAQDGRQIGKVRPDGSAQVIELNDKGKMVRFIAASGAVDEFQYDELGRVVQFSAAEKGATQVAYASDGSISGMQLPTGKQVSFEWSGDGRRLVESDPEGALTEQEFDLWGRPVLHRDAQGAETRYRYDAAGHMCLLIRPDGAKRRFLYDADGRLLEIEDEAGNLTSWNYDAAGRRTAISLPSGARVRCEFDTEDRLVAVGSGNGHPHRYEYDPLGLVARQEFSDGRVERYSHDPTGRLCAVTDGSGGTTQVNRDEAARITEIAYPDGTLKKMEYDEGGRWVRLEWDGHVVERELSDAGLVLVEQQDAFTIEREFGDAGELASVLDSLGRNVKYAYDDDGRTVAIQQESGTWEDDEWSPSGEGRVHRFEYDRLGNLVAWTMPSGRVENRAYDQRGRMIEQTITQGEKVLLRRGYTYDALGRVLSIEDSRRGLKRYQYDGLGRLESFRAGEGAVEHFSYSAQGDLLLPGVDYAQGHRIRAAQQGAWQYDERGLAVRRGSEQLSYSSLGLLRSVKRPEANEVLYEYDGSGRLVKKRTGASETVFCWNEGQIWATRASRGATVEFLYRGAEHFPIEQRVGDDCYSVHTDHLGRIEELIDDTGEVVWENPADVWGARRSPSRTIECPFGMPGQFYDADTGLYYNRHRFYDPGSAHYLTPDPVGLWGGLDAYRYLGDPVNFMDPLGLKCRNKTDDDLLYRGDSRPPSEICSQGFQPRNANAGLSLFEHVEGVPSSGSNWISTTYDLDTAEDFGGGEYVYVISNPGCGEEVDCDPEVQNKYGDPDQSEFEIAFNGAIPPGNIVGYFQPGAGGIASFQGCP